MNAKKTIESLKEGQAAYEKVVGQEIHYVYLNEKTNVYGELIFKPHKHNFLHLCGIDYYSSGKKISANQFYDFLQQDRIDFNGIRKKNSADQKLQIIGEMKDLLNCPNLRIIDEQTTYFNLVFEKAIRTRRKVFGLALDSDRTGAFFPKSLLNLKSNPKGPTLKPGHPVHCIYSVEPKTGNIQILCRTPEFIQYEKSHVYPYKSLPQKI